MTEGRRRLLPPFPAVSLSDLRRWAVSWMDQHPTFGVDPDYVVLSMNELVTNSIRHGSGPVDVALAENSRHLRLGVSDGSDDLPLQPAAGINAEGGRGMVVVDRLTTRWGVHRLHGGGKTVWCEFAAERRPRTDVRATA